MDTKLIKNLYVVIFFKNYYTNVSSMGTDKLP